MMKKVSVLIPTYHSDETLTRAIDSALNQTYENIEVIVVDDNNPGDSFRANTEKIMAQYSKIKKVKYIKHDRNRNGSAARNTAFSNSSGDYISFLDDDDFYYPKKTELQVKYLEEHSDLGGCYCWRHQNGKNVCGQYKGDLTSEILSLEFTPYTSCLMIRRECYESLNGFDESYRRHQDFEFLLRFFKKYQLEPVPSIQVEISTNGVNNNPKGQNLIDVKEKFFSQFAAEIDEIYKTDIKKGRRIYLNHYVTVFKDLIRYGYPDLAVGIYKKYHKKCGPLFLPLFCKWVYLGRVKAISIKLRRK